MKPVHWYLFGSATWFIAWGIQAVLFSWLVTMVLHESPERVGLAQMMMMLPSLFFLLIGGSFADRFGSRRLALIAQSIAVVPPLMLATAVVLHQVSYGLMLVYAVMTGLAQSFLTPARDGMLSQVAQGRIQHTVLLASMVQFSVQLLGFWLASITGQIGATAVLIVQAAVLTFGIFAYSRLQFVPPPKNHEPILGALFASIREGAGIVFSVPTMRVVLVINIATGTCFMGSFMVTLPLLVREVFHGTSAGLSAINIANVLGLTSTIFALLFYGEVVRKGRALIIAHAVGVIGLGALALPMTFPVALLVLFVCGASGGVAMSMARTIMQEQATEGVRGRVMAFFSMSLMGAGPFGALLAGFLVARFGVHGTLITVASAMGLVLLWSTFATSLWRARNTAVPQPLAAG